jgi:hypothetical protein
VRLGVLADEERLHVRPGREGRAGDRIGAHRQPADRRGAPRRRALGDELPQRREAGRAQDGALGVHVVLRRVPARQDDLAHHERVRPQLLDESVLGAHK